MMTPTQREIALRLEAAFAPARLEVVNESSGDSQFRVLIAAAAFAPMSRLARHRAVHAALGPALMGRIHALALEIEGV